MNQPERIDVCPHCGSHDMEPSIQFAEEVLDDDGSWLPVSDDGWPVALCNDCGASFALEETARHSAPAFGPV